jgi:hypothetical protein
MSALGQKPDIEVCRCPLYPQKRTSIEPVAMSALCQKRTLELSGGMSALCQNRKSPN